MTTETQEVVKVKIEVPKPFDGWQDEFVRCMADRIVVMAGRQSAKTFGFTIKGALTFLGRCLECLGSGCPACEFTGRTEPVPVLYAAPTTQQLDRFWFETVNIFSPAIDSGVLKKDETTHEIEIPRSEIRIKAMTAWNASTLRGGNWGLIGLDEFQLINEDIWGVVVPMLLKWNGKLILMFTPPSLSSEGITHAKDMMHAPKLYKQVIKDNTERWKHFHATSFDNPYLSKKALKNISDDMKSVDSYRREILAEIDEIETSWLVYGKFDETQCKIKRFTIPDNWPKLSGHDFGTANPAALFVAQVKLPLPPTAPPYLRYGDYVAFAEYAPGAGYSTAQHIDRFKEITTACSVSVGGNVTTEEEIRVAYRNLGWRIQAPKITRVNAQIDRGIALMENKQFYVFEDLYKLLGEIMDCMWIVDEEKRTTNKIKDEAKYHLLSCYRYLATMLDIKSSFEKKAPKVYKE